MEVRNQERREHGSSSLRAHQQPNFLPLGSTPNRLPPHRLAMKPIICRPFEDSCPQQGQSESFPGGEHDPCLAQQFSAPSVCSKVVS